MTGYREFVGIHNPLYLSFEACMMEADGRKCSYCNSIYCTSMLKSKWNPCLHDGET